MKPEKFYGVFRWVSVVSVVVAGCILAGLLAGCGFMAETTGQDPASQRIEAKARATAMVEQANAAADATRQAAGVSAEATRVAVQMERDRQDHRQALQMQPLLLTIIGAGIAIVAIAAGAMLVWRQQSIRLVEAQRTAGSTPQQLPMVNIVNVLPGRATSRREMWLEAERQAQEAMVVYDERGHRQ